MKKTFLLSLFFVLCFISSALADISWIENTNNEHTYGITEAMSWESAEALAKSYGGYLVTINDEIENQWIVDVLLPLNNSEWLFIGNTDKDLEGSWVWVSGENPNYSNWFPGEPNNQGTEQYGGIIDDWGGGGKGMWNDLSESRILPAIIEIATPFVWYDPDFKTVIKGESAQITKNTTWQKSGSPYIIEENVLVQAEASLIIEPGVQVLFRGRFSIVVKGSLLASGTESENIIFTVLDSNIPQNWNKILLEGYSPSRLEWCRISKASNGIHIQTNALHQIQHTLVTDCLDDGVYLEYGGASISYCRIEKNGRDGFHAVAPNAIIQNTVISDNSRHGVFLEYYGNGASFENCSIVYNKQSGFWLYNYWEENPYMQFCNIYGNGSYAIRMDNRHNLEASHNFWGESVTAEMNTVGASANISAFYDQHDNSELGRVFYNDHQSAPVDIGLILTPPINSPQIPDPLKWYLNTNNGHEYAVLPPTGWENAEHTAISYGAHLVSINDVQENQWLSENILPLIDSGQAWIGCTDKGPEGQWRWISGEPFFFTQWQGSEPNNGGGSEEDYGMIYNYGDLVGSWNDMIGGDLSAILERPRSYDWNIPSPSTIISGASAVIVQDTVWASEKSPYVIQSDVIVESTATLFIEPGVQIFFQGGYSLYVFGSIQARGAEGTPIHFRSLVAPVRWFWGGIEINSQRKSILEWCLIQDADVGIRVKKGMHHQFLNLVVQSCFSDGIQFIEGNADINTCRIAYNGRDGLNILYAGESFVVSSQIIENDRNGISTSYYSPQYFLLDNILNNFGNGVQADHTYEKNPTFRYCNIYGNQLYDFQLNNSLIVEAHGNYWGEAAESMQQGGSESNIASIYDQKDDILRGVVDFSDFKLQPIDVSSQANINTITNFPDPKFRTVIEEFMGVQPGGVFTALMASLKSGSLNCSCRGINSLAGLEFFCNITGLECNQNNLFILDTSHNTQLISLNCGGNQLESLDLSQNLNLQYLSFEDNLIRDITPIVDLPNIIQLNIFENYLDCGDLDNIQTIKEKIGTGFYYANQKTGNLDLCTININNIQNFPDPHFRSAIEEFVGVSPGEAFTAQQAANTAGSMNFSDRKISDITGISFFPSITELNLSHNNIADLRIIQEMCLSYGVTIDVTYNNLNYGDLGAIYVLQRILKENFFYNPQNNFAFSPESNVKTPWSHKDIGEVGTSGTASLILDETFTISGSGYDIWDQSDSFHFLYQSVSSDFEIVTQVIDIEYTNDWAKTGLMIRQSLNPDSPHAFIAVTPRNGVSFQRRLEKGQGSYDSTPNYGHQFDGPIWLKLERRGNSFFGYESYDGQAWTLVGSDSFVIPANVFVGVAVTSHKYGTLNYSILDSISLSPPISHFADLNRDWKLSLQELVYASRLYNAGQYFIGNGLDGFSISEGNRNGPCHKADTNHDWRLSLQEIVYAARLYNANGFTTGSGLDGYTALPRTGKVKGR